MDEINSVLNQQHCGRKPKTTVPGSRTRKDFASVTETTIDQTKGKSMSNLNATTYSSNPINVQTSNILPQIDESQSIFTKLKSEVYSEKNFSNQDAKSMFAKKRTRKNLTLYDIKKSVDYGSCYDSIIKDKLFKDLPKTESFVKFNA